MLHQWSEMVTVGQCLSCSHLNAKVSVDTVIPLTLTEINKGHIHPILTLRIQLIQSCLNFMSATYLSKQKLLLQIFEQKLQEIKATFNFMHKISKNEVSSLQRHF